MQVRTPPQRARTELNGAVASVFASVRLEFAGVVKSTTNFQSVRASCVAPYGPLLSIEPTRNSGLPAGGRFGPSRSAGSRPSPTLNIGEGGAMNEITCGEGFPASI